MEHSLYEGDELLPCYNFLVSIGQGIFSFSKVSNLVSQIEYETIQEGGNNDHPLLFPRQKKSADILTLEKGARIKDADQDFDSLLEGMWVEQVTIMLSQDGSRVEKAFYFEKGLITKRKFSDLDAARGELLIETLEIAHSGLVEISVS